MPLATWIFISQKCRKEAILQSKEKVQFRGPIEFGEKIIDLVDVYISNAIISLKAHIYYGNYIFSRGFTA